MASYPRPSRLLKGLSVCALTGLISSCELSDSTSSPATPATGVTISGSVGDGPVIGAAVSAVDARGAVTNTTSTTTADYSIDLSATIYPLKFQASAGTDTVTGTALEFTLRSVALRADEQTVNLNPFTTVITLAASKMTGGLNEENLSRARELVFQQFSFGLDPVLMPDPIGTPINRDNVAAIVKSSEAMAETVRRTRDAIAMAGQTTASADEVIDSLAGDLTDGVIDGQGPDANPLIGAVVNVLAAQVLVETMQNHLNVGGADATTMMDAAISLTQPGTTQETSNVMITEGILNQARVALAAAQVYMPSPALADLATAVDTLNAGTSSTQVSATLPTATSDSLQPLTSVATADSATLLAVNTKVKVKNIPPPQQDTTPTAPVPQPGTLQVSSASYSVGESAGTAQITIDRVGGSDGQVAIEWSTGTGTATAGTDYTAVAWTPITFAAGEVQKKVAITIRPDAVDEPNETFTVSLRDPSGSGLIGVIASATVSIVDDDPTPQTEPAPQPVVTADYYVAPAGNDNSTGTSSQPFATVQRAITAAQPGDLIYVRGGTYKLTSGIRIEKSGTATSKIKLFAYPGEKPILNGSPITTSSAIVLHLKNASYWHIKGIEVAYSPSFGVVLGGTSSHNTLEMLNVHRNGRLNTAGSGVRAMDSASYNLFLNIDSHHNRDQTTSGTNADGFVVNSPLAVGNVFRGCRAWNNSDDGWDFFWGGPVVIENSYAYRNGYDDAGNPLGDGNGFKLGGGSGGHVLTNCMAWSNKQAGFSRNQATGPMYLYNNTAWNNKDRGFIFWDVDNSVLKNNVSLENLKGDVTTTNQDTFNSWNLPVAVTRSDFVSVSDLAIVGPRAADGTIPANNFMALVPGSDLIDKGTNVRLPYNGAAPDLGAKEYAP